MLSAVLDHLSTTLLVLSSQATQSAVKASPTSSVRIATRVDEDLLYTETMLSLSALYSNMSPQALQAALIGSSNSKQGHLSPPSQKLKPHHSLVQQLPQLFAAPSPGSASSSSTDMNGQDRDYIFLWAHLYARVAQCGHIAIIAPNSRSRSSKSAHASQQPPQTSQDNFKSTIYNVYKQHKYYATSHDLFSPDEPIDHETDFRDFHLPQHTVFQSWRSLRRLVHTASSIPHKASLVKYVSRSINFFISLSRYIQAQKIFKQRHRAQGNSRSGLRTEADEKVIKSIMATNELMHLKRPSLAQLTQTIITRYPRVSSQLPFILAFHYLAMDKLQSLQDLAPTLTQAVHHVNQLEPLADFAIFQGNDSTLLHSKQHPESLYTLANLEQSSKRSTALVDLALGAASAQSKPDAMPAASSKQRENAHFDAPDVARLPSDVSDFVDILTHLWFHFLPLHPNTDTVESSITDSNILHTTAMSQTPLFSLNPRKLAIFSHLHQARMKSTTTAAHTQSLSSVLSQTFGYPVDLLNSGNTVTYSDVFAHLPMSAIFHSVEAPFSSTAASTAQHGVNLLTIRRKDGQSNAKQPLAPADNTQSAPKTPSNAEKPLAPTDNTQSAVQTSSNTKQPLDPADTTQSALQTPSSHTPRRRRIEPVLETPTTSLQAKPKHHATPSTRADQLTEVMEELTETPSRAGFSSSSPRHSHPRSRGSLQHNSSFDNDRFELGDSQEPGYGDDQSSNHGQDQEQEDLAQFEAEFESQMAVDYSVSSGPGASNNTRYAASAMDDVDYGRSEDNLSRPAYTPRAHDQYSYSHQHQHQHQHQPTAQYTPSYPYQSSRYAPPTYSSPHPSQLGYPPQYLTPAHPYPQQYQQHQQHRDPRYSGYPAPPPSFAPPSSYRAPFPQAYQPQPTAPVNPYGRYHPSIQHHQSTQHQSPHYNPHQFQQHQQYQQYQQFQQPPHHFSVQPTKRPRDPNGY
jgi:hypothetical protein